MQALLRRRRQNPQHELFDLLAREQTLLFFPVGWVFVE
jgi:hypothetical protein